MIEAPSLHCKVCICIKVDVCLPCLLFPVHSETSDVITRGIRAGIQPRFIEEEKRSKWKSFWVRGFGSKETVCKR